MIKSGNVLLTLAAVVLWVSTANATFTPGEYTTDEHTVALYHLNEGSGTTIADASGNGNNAVLAGATLPSWTGGEFGGAGIQIAMGNGATSGIQLPMPIMASPWYTLEMNVKWNYASSGPMPGDSGFLGYLCAGNGTLVRAYVDDSNPAHYKAKLQFLVNQYEGYVGTMASSEFSLDSDVWTHVAFTASWENVAAAGEDPVYKGVQRFFVNGVLAARYDGTGFPIPGGNGFIGMLNAGSTPWGGQIDEIRVSNVARTEFGVPEPATMGLLLLGGIAALRKRG